MRSYILQYARVYSIVNDRSVRFDLKSNVANARFRANALNTLPTILPRQCALSSQYAQRVSVYEYGQIAT